MVDTARKKTIQTYYSQRARDYDLQKIRTWKSKKGFEAKILNRVTSALAGLENKPVLEVGIGSGRIGFPLLEEIKPWLVGLDLSKEMLKLAKAKMSPYRRKFDAVLGDAEHLPFVKGVFDATVCTSTMHYFASPEKSLAECSRILKKKGLFVYGDLAMHELDNRGFLDSLEMTLSKAHARYYRPSEMKKLLKNQGFCVSKMEVVPYRKSYSALMEDKGKYFDVKPQALHEHIQEATSDERKLYAIGNNGLTLFYTLIMALKENRS